MFPCDAHYEQSYHGIADQDPSLYIGSYHGIADWQTTLDGLIP